MFLHRNARLGPAGRRELVRDVEGGCSLREAQLGVPARPLLAAAAEPTFAARARASSDLRGAPPHRLGAAADRR